MPPAASTPPAAKRSLAARALSAASIVALVLAVLFFVGAAGASVDGPAAVRGMAVRGGILLALSIALKVASSAIGSRKVQ